VKVYAKLYVFKYGELNGDMFTSNYLNKSELSIYIKEIPHSGNISITLDEIKKAYPEKIVDDSVVIGPTFATEHPETIWPSLPIVVSKSRNLTFNYDKTLDEASLKIGKENYRKMLLGVY